MNWLRVTRDQRFFYFISVCGVAFFCVVCLMGYRIISASHFHSSSDFIHFFTSSNWDPVKKNFGALSFLYATLTTSLFSLLLAFPVALGASLFITEIAPRKLASALSLCVELLSTVPSVIIGLWGLSVVVPVLRLTVQPFLQDVFGQSGFFAGPPYGVGLLAATLILAVMLLPTLTALMRELFKAVPRASVEAVLALGGTRSEAIWIGVVGASKRGLITAAFLGLARAIGETMAVTLVIGNRNDFDLSVMALSQTLSSLMASEIAESVDTAHVEALSRVALVLFLLSLTMRELSKRLIKLTQVQGFSFKSGGHAK